MNSILPFLISYIPIGCFMLYLYFHFSSRISQLDYHIESLQKSVDDLELSEIKVTSDTEIIRIQVSKWIEFVEGIRTLLPPDGDN